MITRIHGDILKSDVEALVNTVNCVGVMGRGIAMQFKNAFPENYKAYKCYCDQKKLKPGQLFVYELGRFENPKYIINFPTKNHWRGKSRIEYIQSGLQTLTEELKKRNIHSVSIPPLGCGLGGLDWNEVRPIIEEAFSGLVDLNVFLYEPGRTPQADEMVTRTPKPRMTSGRAALIGLMRRYLAGMMDVSVSLLEIHKLMYLLQESGEPLKLRFSKGLYGPYAENLRHVLNHIEGHFITGYGDAQDNPDRQIEIKPDAISLAESYIKDHIDTQKRFASVADLITGFETPFGMELLSTVHWVNHHDSAETYDAAIEATYAWGDRKRMFNPQHIEIAWKTLQDKGWLV
jgi:O-acetyl-ADP-ribose deacetylase (regulator of RNase III)/uncharacterized protein YwgA